MKRLAIYLSSLSLLFTACQTENIEMNNQAVNGSQESNVTFTLSLPTTGEISNTRSALYGDKSNSAAGGITNVDMSKYDLRYQLAIYRVDGSDTPIAVAPIKKVVDKYEPVTYSLRLTPNRTYKAVVWADFVEQGSEEDLHYNTTDFTTITYTQPTKVALLNDESRDAYFVTQKFEVENSGVNQSLVLKRPFAKLRAITTDWALHNLEKADNFKITYYGCKRFKNINAVTGVSESDELPATETMFYTGSINKDQKEYALNYDLSTNNRTLVVDYLMTDLSNQTPIHLKFEAFDGTTPIAAHDFKTNVPIQRNWLTTITGNLLTHNATFNISIDEHFANEWNVAEEWWETSTIIPVAPSYDDATKTYTIKTRAEFAWLPGHEAELAGKTVVLDNDIDMSGVDWVPIVDAGSYTFDGKGYTIKNVSINSKYVDDNYKPNVKAYTGIWAKFTGTMKNVTFENITINGRADDAIHNNASGPVDHSDEHAYFAGCVGYAGANYSVMAEFDNVHVKHIVVRASKGKTVQNIGGLLGWLGTGTHTIQNCSVTDAYFVSGDIKGEVGGLIGEILGGRGITIKNCKTDYITIRMGTTDFQDRSGFVGKIKHGSGTKFEGCTAPTVVTYINELGELISNYAPVHPLYGSCEDQADQITVTP
ncbi:Uncharacterised protein [Porphyromonas crevioricanis]|uniref:DUF6562 domain-containing protein n=1 Tax=Porphyromonas crevioricanis TaxID=393921 RepID=A0A2X4SF05_9PORP|nr:DUF6562 domain-containing protein [Porphyromonas crevioricanis]GAD07985.1 hypothetical protein PORCAN_1615 [Porphyromonas crevioricanis JCM 13913]SQH72602.1 Uncharacterised protein [Porphyromonas crevioricanis]